MPSPPATGKVDFVFVLARAVPANIDSLRFIGLDSRNQIRFGPVIRSKASRIQLEDVPVEVNRFRIEYLRQGNILGLALIDVNLLAGGTIAVENPNFTDIEALVSSLQITPTNSSLAKGRTRNLRATATLLDGTQEDVTQAVAWTSSPDSIVEISPTGQATAIGVGQTTVTARIGQVTQMTNLEVTPAELESLSLSPVAPSLRVGAQLQFGAIGQFSDLSQLNVTTEGIWSSSNSSVANVSAQGLANGNSIGQSNIEFLLRGSRASSQLTVVANPPTLVSLRIEPPAALSAPDTQRQFKAIGTYSDGSEADLSTQVRWSSSNPSLAPVSNLSGREGLVSVDGQQLGIGIVVNATHPELASAATSNLAINRLALILQGGLGSLRSDLPNGHLTYLGGYSNQEGAALAISRSGRFVYATETLTNRVAMFVLDGVTGALTASQPSHIDTVTEPRSLALHPQQGFLYVGSGASVGNKGIDTFRVEQRSGALSLLGNVDSTLRINDVAVHPSGNFAYGLYSDNFAVDPGGVRLYSVNSANGTLTFVNQTNTSNSNWREVISSDGRFLYVSEIQEDKIHALAIDANTGQLAPLPNSPFATLDFPLDLVLHPNGKFLYVCGVLNVDVFSRDTDNGSLQKIGSYPAAVTPSSIAIDPTGRFLHVTCQSEFPALDDDVTTYRVDPLTGLLSDIQQISTGDQPKEILTTP